MDLEIAIVAVGLTREQAFELALGDLGAEFFKIGLGLGDDSLIALRLAELDEAELVLELALDTAIAVDRPGKLVALAQRRLSGFRLVPEVRVLGLGVQLFEPSRRVIPVKDASSAGRGRRVPPPPPLESQRA
jgi:hypothetical protein